MAIRQKGIIIKVNQEQFYLEEKEKICTKYIVYTTKPKDGKNFFSKIDMLKYLADYYKGIGVANG